MPVGKPIPVQVDTRFLAGTNRNLAEMVRQGSFRRDLYHRLNVVRVFIPALRDRTEDITPLLEHFSLFYAARYQLPPVSISAEVRAILATYPGRGTCNWGPGSNGSM